MRNDMRKTMFAGAAAAVVLSAVLVAAQSAPAGNTRYVMKMELQPIAGQAPPDADSMSSMMVGMLKKTMMPEGSVEMEFVTDGQSARTEMHNAMAMMPKGTVILYPAGQSDGYVLNVADKTYYVLKMPNAPVLPPGVTLPKPETSVKRSGTFDTIAGVRAEKVNILWRMAMPIPEGAQVPPGVPTELSIDIESWCSADVKMPAAVSRMVNGAEMSMPGMGMDEILKACPFAVRSRMRMSMMPGYEIVQTMTSVTGAEAASPDLYKVPAGYKEVPAPTPKMPGIGGK